MSKTRKNKPATTLHPWLKSALVGLFVPIIFVATLYAQILTRFWFFGYSTYTAFAVSAIFAIFSLRMFMPRYWLSTTIVGTSAFIAAYSYYLTALSYRWGPDIGVVAIFCAFTAVAYGFAAGVIPRLPAKTRLPAVTTITATLLFAAVIVAKHPGLYNAGITPKIPEPNYLQFNVLRVTYTPTYIPTGYRISNSGAGTDNRGQEKDFSITSVTNSEVRAILGENRSRPLTEECNPLPYDKCIVAGKMTDGTPIYERLPDGAGYVFVQLNQIEVRITQDYPIPLSVTECVKILQSLKST